MASPFSASTLYITNRYTFAHHFACTTVWRYMSSIFLRVLYQAIFFVILSTQVLTVCLAQELEESVAAPARRYALILSGGFARGANEASSLRQNYGISADYGVMIRNGLGSGLSPEFHLGYSDIGTVGRVNLGDYTSQIYQADVRLRWYPFSHDAFVRPYLTAGVGIMYCSNDYFQGRSPDARLNPTSIIMPGGGGLSLPLSNDVFVDVSILFNGTLTDDINPYHDNINDGFSTLRAGVVVSLGKSAKDADNDGLSDDREVQYGTDPRLPDTDADGLSDGDEVDTYLTNPLLKDTDIGGIDDGGEVKNNTDPLDQTDDIDALAQGEFMIVGGLEFEDGTSRLLPGTTKVLTRILNALRVHPTWEIEIIGHYDNSVSYDAASRISGDRAQAVRDWLASRGVTATRLMMSGYGSARPIASSKSNEGRKVNRRIEIRRMR